MIIEQAKHGFWDIDKDGKKCRVHATSIAMETNISNLKSIGLSTDEVAEVERTINPKRLYNIHSLFGHEKKPYQRLGQGIHNDIFYYATKTQLEAAGEELTVLIGSDRNFYTAKEEKNQIRNDFNLNYLSDFDETAVDEPWQNQGIFKYLQNMEEKVDIEKTILAITQINQKFIEHLDERIHKLLACFTASTYCFTIFDYMPRINLFALTSCGKSRQSKVLQLLCFNAMWFSKSTNSAQFRSVESTCGTPIVDNFDKLPDESKNACFHFQEVAFEREGKYRLSETTSKGNFKTKKFDVYCPFVINSTMPFESDAVQNRCILIRMEKSENNYPKPNTKERYWEETRNKLRYFTLQNWKEIKKVYEGLENELNNLVGRDQDIWLPILTIAKMSGPETFNEMVTLAKEKIEESKAIDDQEESYKLICRLLLERLKNMKVVDVDLSEFSDEVLIEENGLDRDNEKDMAFVKRNHRLYLKTVKNFLKANPSIWRADRIKHPQNRFVLSIYKTDFHKLVSARNYIELQKEYFDLTDYNQPNQPNQPNPTSP